MNRPLLDDLLYEDFCLKMFEDFYLVVPDAFRRFPMLFADRFNWNDFHQVSFRLDERVEIESDTVSDVKRCLAMVVV